MTIKFCDSKGKGIIIGDIVRRTTDINKEVHGEWVDYDIVLRGIVPCLLYRISEKGQVLPKGYTGGPLSNEYDPKVFMFCKSGTRVRPMDSEIIIIKENQNES